MKHTFRYQHVLIALIATLTLAGLFYLPYLWVRTKTIDAFYARQHLMAQQATTGIQSYFATYGKALHYFARLPSVQEMDGSSRELLENFFSIHQSEISGIHRINAQGALVYSVPQASPDQEAAAIDFCRQVKDHQEPMISELIRTPDQQLLFFSSAVVANDRFEGCVAFSLPFDHIADQYLKSLPLLHDGSVLVFNSTGMILHAPKMEFVGSSISLLQGDARGLAELRQHIQTQSKGIVLLSRDPLQPPGQPGGKVYAVTIPIALPEGQSWLIVIITPAEKVLGAMAEFRSRWLLVTAIAVIAVGLLSFLLSGIAARRKEEQAVRSIKEQLIDLLDLAPMGVFLLGGNSEIVYANQEALQMTGMHAIGNTNTERSFFDYLHEGCKATVAEKISEAAAGQAVRISTAKFIRHDNALLDVVITITSCQSGEMEQRIAIVRDVSDERKALQRQQRLAEAFDQIKESVLIADHGGIVEYVNASLMEMTGYRREEIFGHPVQLLWKKEQEASFDQNIDKVITLGEVWRGKIVNRRKDGSFFVASATVSPVRDADRVITHFVAVQRDITHEMEIEARMRQAQKMEAIGTLAGGIAHDFNNILGGIMGFTDMALLLSTPNTELHNNLLHVRQGGKRAADLVQQILTFSRQSAEKKEPVLMAPLIKESLKLLRASLPTSIEITSQLIAAKATVLAAPVQIQQIVMNLCANAFHSMRDKGDHLLIRLEQVPSDQFKVIENEAQKDWVCLTVKDTGMGMDNDIINRIFTPFFTTKEPGEGTGMGLSVVHGLVLELGGRITVESQPGEGSTFTVLLPLADTGTGNAVMSGEAPLPTGKERILIVDDEKEIREICRMMLNHLGYSVITCSNAQEALSLLQETGDGIDLVITDHTMPKMSGLDLTKAIRQMNPDIPVILCTGYSDRLNSDIARQAGACDLLMKPVDLRGMATATRAALDISR